MCWSTSLKSLEVELTLSRTMLRIEKNVTRIVKLSLTLCLILVSSVYLDSQVL